jgi:hypothetical protein
MAARAGTHKARTLMIDVAMASRYFPVLGCIPMVHLSGFESANHIQVVV